VTTIWPFRHAGLKALSLGLATLLWMVVAGEEVVERGLRIPLELQQFPPGLELVGELPTVVDVRVRGSSGTVARLSPGDIVAVLDLRSARAGRRLYQVTPELVRSPFGVQVIQVVPSSVAMVFEKNATRDVVVSGSFEGEPAPGFVVGRVTVSPRMMAITGPESAVKEATEAITEPVSITDARAPVTETVNVGLLDPSLRERPIANRPVHLRNLRDGLTANAVPALVDVVLRGTREGLARVAPEEVSAYVDLAGLGPGEYQLTVEIETTDRAGVARVDPATVQIRIQP
jgi:YbbR domain-containing protein